MSCYRLLSAHSCLVAMLDTLRPELSLREDDPAAGNPNISPEHLRAQQDTGNSPLHSNSRPSTPSSEPKQPTAVEPPDASQSANAFSDDTEKRKSRASFTDFDELFGGVEPGPLDSQALVNNESPLDIVERSTLGSDGSAARPVSSERSNNKADHIANELLAVAKMLQEELLRHTQWRQEQQKLEYNRKYLNDSMGELVVLIEQRKVVDLASASSRGRTVRKRKKVLEAFETVEVGGPAGLVNDSVIDNSSSEATDGERTSGSTSESDQHSTAQNMTQLYERYINDYAELKDQAQKVSSLTDELSSLSFRLEGKLTELARRVESPSFAGMLRMRPLGNDLSFSDLHGHDRSGASTPPLVREYFDRMGDIGIYSERLFELDDTHEEGRVEREFLRDRGDRPDVEDDEFERRYEYRREQIQQDLARATKEANELHLQCEEANLNINDFRQRKPSFGSSSRAASSQADEQDPSSFSPQIRQIRPLEASDRKRQTIIPAWLDDVNQDDHSQPDAEIVSIKSSPATGRPQPDPEAAEDEASAEPLWLVPEALTVDDTSAAIQVESEEDRRSSASAVVQEESTDESRSPSEEHEVPPKQASSHTSASEENPEAKISQPQARPEISAEDWYSGNVDYG